MFIRTVLFSYVGKYFLLSEYQRTPLQAGRISNAPQKGEFQLGFHEQGSGFCRHFIIPD